MVYGVGGESIGRRAVLGSSEAAAIARVVGEEAERLGVRVEKIILFGSRARGDYRADSDYDILVVVEDCPRGVRKRLAGRVMQRAV